MTSIRCGGILNNHLTANLLERLSVKEFFEDRVKIRLNYDHEFGVHFLASPVLGRMASSYNMFLAYKLILLNLM